MSFKPRMTLAQATQAICAIGIGLAALLVILALHGCATAEEPCGYMPVARDASTVQYVRVYCLGTGV